MFELLYNRYPMYGLICWHVLSAERASLSMCGQTLHVIKKKKMEVKNLVLIIKAVRQFIKAHICKLLKT